ncbi:acetyltransferase [Cryobacterium sp. Y11]|uniref:acetyltransferase n=1 Tax=Cryobacterium sp. Y11 TaxID=2045016 RepID=UPI000CE414B1|nr:acetyltransferase [Cryobacterium sp. Y11]
MLQREQGGAFGLLGNGGQAREVSEFTPREIEFYAVSSKYLIPGRGDIIDINTTIRSYLDRPVIAAVGAPGARRLVVDAWGGKTYGTVIAPEAWVAASAGIGLGSVIAPGSVVTAATTIHQHVLVNVSASVSHDCDVASFVTISPGVRIAGNCRIGAGSFLGIGAVVSHGLQVAEGTVLGAGAVLMQDTVPGGVYVGVPARYVRTIDGWLHEI